LNLFQNRWLCLRGMLRVPLLSILSPLSLSRFPLSGSVVPFLCVFWLLSQLAFSEGSGFRTLSAGAASESVVRGFDAGLYVTLMGTKRETGDGGGAIFSEEGDRVTHFVTGLDDPKDIVLAGGQVHYHGL
jgi:hypothetical protein